MTSNVERYGRDLCIRIIGSVPFDATKVSKRAIDQSVQRNFCPFHSDWSIERFETLGSSNRTHS